MNTETSTAHLHRFLHACTLALVGLALLARPLDSLAANRTWAGNTDATWSTAANWGGTAPAAGDALIFGAAGSSGTKLNNNITAGTSFASITFNDSASAFTFTNNSITLGGNVVVGNSITTEAINFNMALSAARTFTVNSGTLSIGGSISGAFGLTANGAGTLTLAGANTYTGTTTINAGTVKIDAGAGGSLYGTSPWSALTISGTGGFNYDNTTATTAKSQNLGTLTFSTGEGTIRLARTANYDEVLTFSSMAARTAGAMANFVPGGGSAAATNGFVVSGVTANTFVDRGLFYGGSTYAWNDAGGYLRGMIYGTDTGTVTNGAATALASATHQQITGAISAQTNATFTTLNIAGNNNLTLASAQTVTLNGILKSGNTAGGATISGGAGIRAASGVELVIRTDGANDALTISTPVLANGANALTKGGAGKLTLSGASTYTGTTYVDAGMLKASVASVANTSGAFGLNSPVTLANAAGAGLDITGFDTQIGILSGGGSVGGNVTLGTNTLTIKDAANGTYSGVISGSGVLNKIGTSTLTLSGVNTYSGGTTVSGGSLSLGNTANTTLGTGTVTVNTGATVSLNGNNNLTNAFVLNGATLVNGNSFSANLNGPITVTATSTFNVNTTGQILVGGNVSGPGGFIKLGTSSGAVTFSGTNTFTGAISVSAGTISAGSLNSVSGGTASSNLGAPTNAAGGTIALGAATTTGILIYTGAGETTDRVVQLAGTTGGATITQGGTASGFATTRGQSGLLKFTSNVSAPGSAAADNRKTLTLTHAASANTGFVLGQGELSGSIGDSLLGTAGQLATSITKAGSGTWTLSGTNTYTGTTKVQAGVLICTRANALGAGALDITDGARLELDYVGTRQISALTFNGAATRPNGTYGSSSSMATTKDDTHFAGLGTVTVGAITSPTTNTLALTSGANPSSGGASLSFTATISGGAAPTGGVILYDGLTAIGTNALNGSFQAAFTTSILPGGVHTITAFYLGNASNASSASVPLSQTVVESRPATTTSLARTSGANPSNPGAAVTFTATVAGATPAGTVVFYDGTTQLGSAALNGSAQAGFTTTALVSGWRGITARYLGNVNNAPSASSPPLWQTVKPPAGNGKLKVFIMAGQSNMQGKGRVETGRDPNNLSGANITGGLGSLRHMLNANTNTYGYLADTSNPTDATDPGWRTMTNVWVSYWTDSATNRNGNLDADFGDLTKAGRIGPEYGFGLIAGSQLGDQVLLIKTAWGGKSLKVDFLPPSSGGTVGPYYTNMVGTVHRVLDNLHAYFPAYTGGGYEIAGFLWHQGWNDIGEPMTQYETNLVNLIHDLRAEFGAPNLPVVIGTTGMANANGNQLLICAAQATVANPLLHPELAGSVFTVDGRYFDYGQLMGMGTEGYHWFWNAESYFKLGQSMGLGMMSLLSSPPALTNAPATGITTNSAALQATVAWPYSPCNVIVCWNTLNGGTNTAAWVNSAYDDSWTNATVTNQYGVPGDYVLAGGALANVVTSNLSYTLSGLAPNTTYYFTFCATNKTVSDMTVTNTQTLWATNVQSFTTLATALPTPPAPSLPGSAITMSGGVPSFTFGTTAGYKYRLDYKNALTNGTWLPVIAPPNFPAPNGWSATSTGNPMSLTDTNTAAQPQRFYRLEAANP